MAHEVAGVLDEILDALGPVVPGGTAAIAKVRAKLKAAQKKERDRQMLIWAAVAFFVLTSR